MKKEVYTIDAEGMAPGRIASEAARILQGKNKPGYVPSQDNAFCIEIKNAAKMNITGKKMNNYVYYSHSGYPGGLRRRLMKEVPPEFIILHALRKMLPDNSFRKKRLARIKFI